MGDAVPDLPVKARTAKASALLSLKRTFDMFSGNFNFGQRTAADADSQKLKLACKVPIAYWVWPFMQNSSVVSKASSHICFESLDDLFGVMPPTVFAVQIQAEYEGLKKFRLEPGKEKGGEAANGKSADAGAPKSTTAKLLDEIAAKKSERCVSVQDLRRICPVQQGNAVLISGRKNS